MKLFTETLIRVATIGTFDGVHTGHRLVLDTLRREADSRRLFPAVFVLDRHPLELIAPDRAPRRLMDSGEKEQMITDLGFDVFNVRFTEETRALDSEAYMRRLRDTFGVGVLVVGHDNRFGHDLEADIDTYREHGKKLGIVVVEAPVAEGVSSTVIRNLIADGDVSAAAEKLGRNYTLSGEVVPGNKLGRTLGFPTANLQPLDALRLVPGRGVYAAMAGAPDGKNYPAMVNIGVRPTVADSGADVIEAHLIGFDSDLYGKKLTLSFVDRIRPERQFASTVELAAQLAADRDTTLKLLTDKQ